MSCGRDCCGNPFCLVAEALEAKAKRLERKARPAAQIIVFITSWMQCKAMVLHVDGDSFFENPFDLKDFN